METKAHYENHLAQHYTWMYGGAEAMYANNEEYLRKHHIFPSSKEASAIDLGAGSGFCSIPLGKAGYKVVAIDFSPALLQELRVSAKGMALTIIEQDLLETNFSLYNPELVVCMVDTLLHLQTAEVIQLLLKRIYAALLPGGRFICSFRDLSVLPQAEKRFIPVRSEKERIFTCFLEDAGNAVTVYDIVHVWKNQQWIQQVSSYKKLKITAAHMQHLLQQAGFASMQAETIKGLIHIIALK